MSITMTKRRALALRQVGINKRTKARREAELQRLFKSPVYYSPERMKLTYTDGSDLHHRDPRRQMDERRYRFDHHQPGSRF